MTEQHKNEGLPEPSFPLLVSQLGAQARIELGEIENPMTGKAEVALDRAKFTIDMLEVVKDRTEGNLTPEETQFLDAVLYELRMNFVNKKSEAEAGQAS